jgi:hypothetical protein
MKSLRPVLLISSILGILGLGFAVVMLLWGPDHIEFEGREVGDLLGSGDLIPLIVIPISLIIAAVVMLPMLRMAFPGVIKNAISAQARVMKVWDTGVSINDNPQVGLLLHVMPSMSAAFDVETKLVVSRLNAALVQPGITADVKYDAQNPKRLQIVNLNVEGIGAGSAEARLEQLKVLLDKRLITEDEYNRKREEIIQAL